MRRMYQEDSGTSNQTGFTLVELAIVMTIIGLLIGGVLKGQEMIANARLTATIAQIKSYYAAVETFRDRFDQLPGDMVGAQSKLPNCTAAGQCFNGNSDGRIGTPVAVYTGGQHIITTENTQFWRHMALADLIAGVNSAATSPAWGKTHPASPMVGGFTIVQAIGSDGPSTPVGLILRLHSCLDCANIENVGTASVGTAAVSPAEASYIDRKMDDGRPGSGSVRTTFYGNGSSTGCEEEYIESNKIKNCTMMFKIF